MIGLNLKGPFRLSALIGARMCDQDWAEGETGSIINVSSNASQRPNMTAAVYGAAKLSLNYFTELFAEVRACELLGDRQHEIIRTLNFITHNV